jgi:outer membrane protein OmpA-like peptidoglycan-associated protein
VAGAAGPSGEPGPQGVAGATGAQGPAGVINRWTSYRDFQFDSNQAELRASETNKVSEIALYMKANPSLKVGIDGSMEPRNQDLSDQRISTVRDALIKAGVPTSRIEAGTFGDRKLAHDGRVTVLIRTANY